MLEVPFGFFGKDMLDVDLGAPAEMEVAVRALALRRGARFELDRGIFKLGCCFENCM